MQNTLSGDLRKLERDPLSLPTPKLGQSLYKNYKDLSQILRKYIISPQV